MTSSEVKLYQLKYNVEPGSFTQDELEKEGAGGCDRIVILSIIDYPGQGLSQLAIARNSDGSRMESRALFSAWVKLAYHLITEEEGLTAGQYELCRDVYQLVYKQHVGKSECVNDKF